MSESDEEGAFASADEGDSREESTKSEPSPGVEKVVADTTNTEKEKAEKAEHPAKDKTIAAADIAKNLESVSLTAKEAKPEDGKVGEIASGGAEATGEDQSDDKEADNRNMLDKLSGAAKNADWGWGGISTWGTSVLNTASSSVQTFADSVGEGLHVVFDPLDAPLPEEYPEDDGKDKSDKPKSPAKTPDDEEFTTITDQPHGGSGGEAAKESESGATGKETEQGKDASWFPGWGMGGITSVVKKTVKGTTEVFKEQSKTLVSGGKSLVSGSLDVLESIGKKTYDVIAEGDHGLKNTIKKTKEKTNLSQMLREAKERAESQVKEEEEFAETRKAHFGAQFDEFQGLVQLEALEMLSNQCEGRVQGMLTATKGQQLDSIKKDLVAIKHAFQLEDDEEEEDPEKDHEFDRLLADYVGRVGLNTTPERLIHTQEKCRKYLMDCQRDIEDEHLPEAKKVHEAAIQSLAEFTARSIEYYHRVGQLILLDKAAPLSSYKTKATSLASATRVLCAEVGIFSVKFTHCLSTLASKADDSSSVNPMITNVYLEASNSSTYIQDAFLLLLPVVQQGAIEAHQRKMEES